jgi:hypothetical protein
MAPCVHPRDLHVVVQMVGPCAIRKLTHFHRIVIPLFSNFFIEFSLFPRRPMTLLLFVSARGPLLSGDASVA